MSGPAPSAATPPAAGPHGSRLDRMPMWLKLVLACTALYAFLVGIGAMGTGFKLLGKGYTETLLGTNAGPLVSLFIGILATTLVQSSSTTTSLVVGMVAAGAIPFESAIYMVMGANVGTTVTNTIVSLGHVTRSNEYKRAFAAATVHDFFNLIVLAVLFPLEYSTGFLHHMCEQLTVAFQGVGGTKLASPVKLATKPVIGALKDACEAVGGGGVLLVVVSILLTFVGLIAIVKMLKSVMSGRLENLFDRVIFKSPYRSLAFGVMLTIFVQSSSVTTSIGVPLVGAGVLTIRQVFPYTMGANIGTTVTALIAALAAYAGAGVGGEADALLGLSLAFHHVLFNIVGVILVWPFRAVPIRIAEAFAALAVWNRAVPFVYIIVTFYLIPFIVVWLGR